MRPATLQQKLLPSTWRLGRARCRWLMMSTLVHRPHWNSWPNFSQSSRREGRLLQLMHLWVRTLQYLWLWLYNIMKWFRTLGVPLNFQSKPFMDHLIYKKIWWKCIKHMQTEQRVPVPSLYTIITTRKMVGYSENKKSAMLLMLPSMFYII